MLLGRFNVALAKEHDLRIEHHLSFCFGVFFSNFGVTIRFC